MQTVIEGEPAVFVDNIPLELMERKQWVCWRYVSRDGKRTKVPFQPTGQAANSKDPATWSTFEAVVTALNTPMHDHFDGVGFVFSAADDFIGVDIDHVIQEGEVASWVEEIVRDLDTYTEFSPSGTGIHMILRTTAPLDHGNRYGTMGLEIYQEGRYFTITGHRVTGTNSSVRNVPAKEFTAVYERAHKTHSLLQDIQKRAKDDESLAALWNGECSDYDDDHSRADMALAAKIAYMVGGDTEWVDRLFRHSGLMRPKWDSLRGEETYGQQTVRKAAVEAAAKATQTTLDRAYQRTDDGNAQRLVDLCGDDLRFSRQLGWMHWTGKRWETDDTAPLYAARQVISSIQAEIDVQPDKKEKAAHFAWYMASQSKVHIAAMVDLAKSDAKIRIHAEDFDTHKHLLNCRNGVVNLYTGELYEHNRDLYLTKLVDVDYNPMAPCPEWSKFLDKIFAADQDMIRFIQRAVGYSLTGLNTERAFFIMHGRGANGKTTFIEALVQILGDYTHKSRIETFIHKKNGGGVPNDIAALKGARFVYSSESEAGMRLSEGLIKELTGGDKIQARFLRQEYFEFSPECKLWIATNHRPDIKGVDDGIWNRVKLIPFAVQIPPHEQESRDVVLGRFAEESEGILAWAVKGCVEWRAVGLGVPSAVVEATEEYREESDPLGDFFDQYCEFGKNNSEKMESLYNAYMNWCGETGQHAWSQNAFGRALTERGYLKSRSGGGPTMRKGLKLKKW